MEADDLSTHFEIWETVAQVLDFGDMPPEEEEHRPSSAEIQQILSLYENRLVHSVEVQAGDFRPRRLSRPEYRNTLRSVLGFDLETTIKVAEQTVTETLARSHIASRRSAWRKRIHERHPQRPPYFASMGAIRLHHRPGFRRTFL